MKITEILSKIVENPKTKSNYDDLVEFYTLDKQKDLADAINYLITKKYVDNNIDKQNWGHQENTGLL